MNVRQRFHTALLFMVLLGLAGCGIPVPPEKSAYVGEWSARDMSLTITQDGKVDYWRKRGSNTTTINAPLKKFEGDNFVVGVGLWTTTFTVSKPPYQDSGRWRMTVDGVELTRSAGNLPGQPVLRPQNSQ